MPPSCILTSGGSFIRVLILLLGLPSWLRGKVFACQCRRSRRLGFDPWVGKIPCRRAWHPTPVLLPGEPHGQRSPAGCSAWGHSESDMTDWMHRRHPIWRLLRKPVLASSCWLLCLLYTAGFSSPSSPPGLTCALFLESAATFCLFCGHSCGLAWEALSSVCFTRLWWRLPNLYPRGQPPSLT